MIGLAVDTTNSNFRLKKKKHTHKGQILKQHGHDLMLSLSICLIQHGGMFLFGD